MSDQGFPADGVELSVLLVVNDIQRARAFYRDVLGATVVRETGRRSGCRPVGAGGSRRSKSLNNLSPYSGFVYYP